MSNVESLHALPLNLADVLKNIEPHIALDEPAKNIMVMVETTQGTAVVFFGGTENTTRAMVYLCEVAKANVMGRLEQV